MVVLNPLEKPSLGIGLEDKENREERKKEKKRGDFAKVAALMKEIRNIDLRLVDLSSFLIVNLDLDIYPTCQHFFQEWDDLLRYLDRIDSKGCEQGRWRFFDLEGVLRKALDGV